MSHELITPDVVAPPGATDSLLGKFPRPVTPPQIRVTLGDHVGVGSTWKQAWANATKGLSFLKPKLPVPSYGSIRGGSVKPKVVKSKSKPKRKLYPSPVLTSGTYRLSNGIIAHPGDQLSYPIGSLGLFHHAIYVGDINPTTLRPPLPGQRGIPYVVEMMDTGIQLAPVRQLDWRLVGRGTASTVTRAFTRLMTSPVYRYFWQNCETIANEIRLGIPLSFQSVNIGAGTFAFLGAAGKAAGAAALYVGSTVSSALRHGTGSIPGRTDQRTTPVPELPSLAEDLLPTLKMRRRGLPERRRQVHPLISLRRRTGPDVFDPAIASSRKRPRHHLGPLLGDSSGVFLLKKKRGFELV